MSNVKWETFFDLLGEIVNQKGSYQEKAKEVLTQAEEDGRSDFEEFLSWFNGEVPTDDDDDDSTKE